MTPTEARALLQRIGPRHKVKTYHQALDDSELYGICLEAEQLLQQYAHATMRDLWRNCPNSSYMLAAIEHVRGHRAYRAAAALLYRAWDATSHTELLSPLQPVPESLQKARLLRVLIPDPWKWQPRVLIPDPWK